MAPGNSGFLSKIFKTNPTNADMVIGGYGVVEEALDSLGATGRVRVDHISWKAKSADNKALPAGTTVKVLDLQGVTVIVTDRI